MVTKQYNKLTQPRTQRIVINDLSIWIACFRCVCVWIGYNMSVCSSKFVKRTTAYVIHFQWRFCFALFVHFNLSGVWLFKVNRLDEVNINFIYAQCFFIFFIGRRIYTIKLLRVCKHVCHWYWMLRIWTDIEIGFSDNKNKFILIEKQQHTKTHYENCSNSENKRNQNRCEFLQKQWKIYNCHDLNGKIQNLD